MGLKRLGVFFSSEGAMETEMHQTLMSGRRRRDPEQQFTQNHNNYIFNNKNNEKTERLKTEVILLIFWLQTK